MGVLFPSNSKYHKRRKRALEALFFMPLLSHAFLGWTEVIFDKSFFIFIRVRGGTRKQKKIQPNMNILRPLSPHLPIYKPQLTSTFPISNRISGAFLATIIFFFFFRFVTFLYLDRMGLTFSIGLRILFIALRKFGCPRGLVLSIGLAVRALLAAETTLPHMASSGSSLPEIEGHKEHPRN